MLIAVEPSTRPPENNILYLAIFIVMKTAQHHFKHRVVLGLRSIIFQEKCWFFKFFKILGIRQPQKLAFLSEILYDVGVGQF